MSDELTKSLSNMSIGDFLKVHKSITFTHNDGMLKVTDGTWTVETKITYAEELEVIPMAQLISALHKTLINPPQ